MTDLRTEFDPPWKEALDFYFQDFIHFFFPQIYTGCWNCRPH